MPSEMSNTDRAGNPQPAPSDLPDLSPSPPDDFPGQAESYPVWQWLNGNHQLSVTAKGTIAYTGGWFMEETYVEALGATDTFPFPRWTLQTEGGKAVPGRAAVGLYTSILQYRRCWVAGEGKNFSRFAWPKYDEALDYALTRGCKPRGQIQVFAAVRNCHQYGPFVLSIKGVCQKYFKDGIIDGAHKILKAPLTGLLRAKHGDKREASFRMFWLMVQAARVKDGASGNKPAFLAVGKGGQTSLVTPPWPTDLPKQPLRMWSEYAPFYVGNEILAKHNEWAEEALEWRDSTEWLEATNNSEGGE